MMQLNEEQAHDLMHVLGSKGWRDVIAPYMQLRGKNAMKDLLMTPAERKSGESDDALRHRVKEAEHYLMVFTQTIEVWQENMRREKQQEQEANQPARGTPYGTDATMNGEPVQGAKDG